MVSLSYQQYMYIALKVLPISLATSSDLVQHTVTVDGCMVKCRAKAKSMQLLADIKELVYMQPHALTKEVTEAAFY